MASDIAHEHLFDAEMALALAAGDRRIRWEVVQGVLGMFSEAGEMSSLFDVTTYGDDTSNAQELSHRAVGLAKQAALPALEALCKKLELALQANNISAAVALGRQLMPLVTRTRSAVATAGIEMIPPG